MRKFVIAFSYLNEKQERVDSVEITKAKTISDLYNKISRKTNCDIELILIHRFSEWVNNGWKAVPLTLLAAHK
jgi:hypothetical protein